MQIEDFSKLFPLFSTAAPDVLTGLLAVAVQHQHPAGRAVLIEDAWGNALYFVLEGWVKVRRLITQGEDRTIALLGPGAFFGEMAILDESPRSTDVVALSHVQLLSIPAQKFTQALLKDPQLHFRMLQLMVQRVRQSNIRFELQQHPPAVKLANTLVMLGRNYGREADIPGAGPGGALEIFQIPMKDLADISDIGVEDTAKIFEKLVSKGWVKLDESRRVVCMVNFAQLVQLASHN